MDSPSFSESPFKDPQPAPRRATGSIEIPSPKASRGTAETPPAEPIFLDNRPPAAPQAQTPEPADDVYAPPGADISPSSFPGAAVGRFGTITEDMVYLLERSGSWMKYSAILSYILSLTYLVMGIITATKMSQQMEETGAPGGLVFLIYMIFAVIVFTIAHHLRSASRKAKMVRQSGNPAMDFSEILEHEHYVWKISGVISLLFLLIFIPALFFMVAGFFQALVN